MKGRVGVMSNETESGDATRDAMGLVFAGH